VPRRQREQPDRFSQTLEKVRRRYERSPLSCVGQKLAETIRDIQHALQAGHVIQEDANKLAGYVERVIEILPQSFEDRFRFDAGMLAAFSEEWCNGGAQLSPMIVPRPAEEWGHKSLTLPAYRGESAYVIDLILTPGKDNLDDIDLLTYPFLGHELGHNVLFRHGAVFSQDFEKDLQRHANKLLRQSLADRGVAKTKAHELVERTRRVWTPTPNHHNWAHEIAVDIIAFWTCGPAYLASLFDVLDDTAIDPYQVGQSHPPYEVRAKALLRAANQLGWDAQTHRLSELTQSWTRSEWRRGKNNLYTALAEPALIEACVHGALKACQTLGLPKSTPQAVRALHERLRRGDAPDLGSELVLAAWLVREDNDESAYEKWERETIRALLVHITL
jgi:hypothetical protein